MTHVRPQVYRDIQGNDPREVEFQEPLSDATRTVKRNLLVASFVALLISLMNLEVTGFLGLQTRHLVLGNELAQGLAAVVVIYLFVSFASRVYVDVSAWQFKREVQATRPYLELIKLLESQLNSSQEQLEDAIRPLRNVSRNGEVEVQVEGDPSVKSCSDKLQTIDDRLQSVANEIEPLIEIWRADVARMGRLDRRLKARFFSLWVWEIGLPFAVGLLALYETVWNLGFVVQKITS